MLQQKKLPKDEFVKVSKIDVPSISTDWIAYRVDMKNSGQRRWTTHMCGLIKHFDD